MRLPHRSRLVSSSGFSLVELAVYIVVLGIISTIIATVVVSLFRSEQTVSAVTSTSNDSQIVSTVLTNDIRNARAFRVGSSGNEVIASVAGSDPSSVTWQCVRWVVASTSNSLTREVKPDGGTVPTWGAGTVMATDLRRVSGTQYFSGSSTATESGSATGTLSYGLAFKTTGNGELAASGQVSNRVAGAGAKCW